MGCGTFVLEHLTPVLISSSSRLLRRGNLGFKMSDVQKSQMNQGERCFCFF